GTVTTPYLEVAVPVPLELDAGKLNPPGRWRPGCFVLHSFSLIWCQTKAPATAAGAMNTMDVGWTGRAITQPASLLRGLLPQDPRGLETFDNGSHPKFNLVGEPFFQTAIARKRPHLTAKQRDRAVPRRAGLNSLAREPSRGWPPVVPLRRTPWQVRAEVGVVSATACQSVSIPQTGRSRTLQSFSECAGSAAST